MALLTSSGVTAAPNQAKVQTVSCYAAPAVKCLVNAQQAVTNAAVKCGMPAYTGQLTAGPSQLQKQAYCGISSLQPSSGLVNAQSTLGNISCQARGIASTFSPTLVSSDYKTQNVQANYNPRCVTTGQFGQCAAAQYMNPYLSAALNPQLEALNRQAQINTQGCLGKLTQAGAFGGSRQAVLQGQNQYNLLAQQANLIGQGYNQAYKCAEQQFTTCQARALCAQKQNVQQAQYAAQLGLCAQKQNLQQAQYAAQLGLCAQKQNVQQAEYGSTLGLQGLQAATSAAQAQAQAGYNQTQSQLAQLQAMNTMGVQSQAMCQAALTAQYNQYLAQLQFPQNALNAAAANYAKLPMTTCLTYGAAPSGIQSAAGAISGINGLICSATGLVKKIACGSTPCNPCGALASGTTLTAAQIAAMKAANAGNSLMNPSGTSSVAANSSSDIGNIDFSGYTGG